ncbi:MAG: 8-amino-7-oxononanoate synthase, partial [Dietzia cercidiphylli]
RVGCFRPPSVPEGTARLRLTARADISGADLARASDVLARVLEEHGYHVPDSSSSPTSIGDSRSPASAGVSTGARG